MFSLKEFVLNNLISGVSKGTFTREYASILATNYFLKGILGQEDLERFDEETTVKEIEEQIEAEETPEENSGILEIQEENEEISDEETEVEGQ